MQLHHALVRRIPDWAVIAFSKRYVAGPSLQAALERADALWATRQLRSTLDVLGEHVAEEAQARHALAIYLEAAHAVAERPHCSLSLKPGQLGHYVDPALCAEQVRTLAQVCQRQATRLTLDMEDVDLTDATLALYQSLRPEFPILGAVLQTRLFRTPSDLEALAGLGARLRLCLGAYQVSGTAGHTRKSDAKQSLLRLLPRALEVCSAVEIATHDRALVTEARQLLGEALGPSEKVEFQMLLGVPRARLQDELLAEGRTVRLYVPFAESWTEAVAYLRRRLDETPSLGGLVMRNLLPGQ